MPPRTTKPKNSGSGNSPFDQIKGDKGSGSGKDSGLSQAENKFLGPGYNYVDHIKTPSELGMSSEGSFNALADNIAGLLAYIDVLVIGHGKLGTGSKAKNPNGTYRNYPKPLGNKYFFDTAVKCKDDNGEEHVRSIYINNVPDGGLPFVSMISPNIQLSGVEGLLPGVLSNLSQIHPMQILGAFTAGSSPKCQAITMEVSDQFDLRKLDTRYVTTEDIIVMPKNWFPSNFPQKNYLKEGFDMAEEEDKKTPEKNPIDYSQMPDDMIIKFYYSMLGLLGIYILIKMLIKKK
jgi:hypothetical protein